MRLLLVFSWLTSGTFLSFAQTEVEVRLFLCTEELEDGHTDTLLIESYRTPNILRIDVLREMSNDWEIVDFSSRKSMSFVNGEVFFNENPDLPLCIRENEIPEYLIHLLVQSSGVDACKVTDSPSKCIVPAIQMQVRFPLDGCYIKD